MDNNETVVSISTEQVVAPQPAQNTAPLPGESAEQRYDRLYGQAPVPVAPSHDPALTSTLQSLQAEIAALRASQPAPVAQPVSKLEWVEKIRAGDFDAAQESMKQALVRDLQPQLEEVRQRAYNDALNATQVSREVERYLDTVKAANPELIQFERYLNGPVTERIQIAQQAGRIKSSGDFLREYKAAVDSEVGSLRNLSLQLRGAGKDEALTRTSDVLRSTTLTPQQVQSAQSQPGAPQNSQSGESTEDYFSRRRADESRRRGLS